MPIASNESNIETNQCAWIANGRCDIVNRLKRLINGFWYSVLDVQAIRLQWPVIDSIGLEKHLKHD